VAWSVNQSIIDNNDKLQKTKLKQFPQRKQAPALLHHLRQAVSMSLH
jgi:hypothetical protein